MNFEAVMLYKMTVTWILLRDSEGILSQSYYIAQN